MTRELKNAFEHIRKFYPNINAVKFDSDGRWLYFNKETGYTPIFSDDISVSILQEAIDSIDTEGTFYYKK